MADARIREAAEGDVAAAYSVLEACRFGPWFDLSFEQFESWWPRYTGAWMAEACDEVVGFGGAVGESVEVYVTAAARRRGIGTRLLAEAEAVVPGPRLEATARRDEEAAAPFLGGHGYAPIAEVWVMEMDVEGETAAPEWPDGFAVRTFDVADARGVKEVLDAAYAKEPGFRVGPFERWRAFMLGDSSFEAESWFVVEAPDGSLAAAALNWKEGFVKDLVVHPDHRRRGLGRALMLHTFAHFQARGARSVALKTDSRNTSQAWRFYERLGMRKTRTYDEYEKRR